MFNDVLTDGINRFHQNKMSTKCYKAYYESCFEGTFIILGGIQKNFWPVEKIML